MYEILFDLEEHLKEQRPEYYTCLNEPLNEEQIAILENKYGFKLPKELKVLYQWKNGQREDCFESFVNNSVFMSLENVLETARDLTSMIGYDFEVENWWNKNWLPIFHNGGGSYICFDLNGEFTGRKGQIIEFWKNDNDRSVIASGLKNFLKQLVYHYENNVSLDEFVSIDYESGFPQHFYVK